MELRLAESGGIQAGAVFLEEALSGGMGPNLEEEAFQEVYTHGELEVMDEATAYRFKNLYWAKVCLSMAEAYFEEAAIPHP